MDYFIIFGLLGFGGMIIGFIGYKTVTGNIIKDLERENEILKTDNERLRTALRTKRPAQETKYLIVSTPYTKNNDYARELEASIKASKSGIIRPTNYTFEDF